MGKILKEYIAKLDTKNRITVRDSKYAYYYVAEFNDGTIVLRPQVLVDPEELSENTLNMMDKSMENYKSWVVSKPIDIDKYLGIIDEE